MKYDFDRLIDGLGAYQLSLNEHQLRQFEIFYEMLIERNRVMNLTAITEWEEVVEKHFLDSLAIVQTGKFFPEDGGEEYFQRELSVMDVGSGAGFPGIPLKIALPKLRLTLTDSLNKRVRFLSDVIEKLDFKDIHAIHERAEILAGNASYREKYDLVVSRAVANLSTLSEYCLPFVRVGGAFISYKSGACEEEIVSAETAVRLLGGERRGVERFRLGESGRSFVIIDKKRTTPKRFPRKAGIPAKEPLS